MLEPRRGGAAREETDIVAAVNFENRFDRVAWHGFHVGDIEDVVIALMQS